METKKCSKCGEVKPVSEFYRDKYTYDGMASSCKSCYSKYHNRVKKAMSNKLWQDSHKDPAIEIKKEDKKYLLSINQKRCGKCGTPKPFTYFNKNKGHSDGFSSICKSCEKKYKKKNLHRILQNRKQRRQDDIQYYLQGILRARFIKSVQRCSKTPSVLNLLGCNISELKTYLESLFTDGMTWDNHSLYGWHIDHIKPCTLFDLTDPEQQKQCFHYTNLQPLWAVDNLSKGAKY